MKNSKKSITAAITLVFAAAAGQANAGNLQFYGTVGTNSCEATVNGYQNSSIYLDEVQDSEIDTYSKGYKLTAFTIQLLNCTTTAASSLNVQFQSDGAVVDGGVLKNTLTDSNASTNVDLALYNDEAGTTKINVNQSGGFSDNATSIIQSTGANSASQTYYVGYYMVGTGTPTADPGEVHATVNYVVRYP